MSFRRFMRCGGGSFAVAPTPSPSPTPSPTPTPTPTPGALLSGDTSRLSTSGATKRSAITGQIASEVWAGYNNQGPAYTTVVTSLADAVAAAWYASRNYGGVGQWSAITLVSGGDYTSDNSDMNDSITHMGPQFGSGGGLLFRTDNTDPLITGAWRMRGRHIEVNGLKFGRAQNTGTGGADAAIYVEGPASPTNQGPALFKFKANRIGAYYNPAKSISDYQTFSLGIYTEFAEQLILEDNSFKRTHRSVSNYNTRLTVASGNDFDECIQNAFSTSPYTPEADWQNFKNIGFADNDCRQWLHHNTHRGAPDAADTIGAFHFDWMQVMDIGGYQAGHTPPGPTPNPPGTLRTVIENNILASFATKMDGSNEIPAINVYVPTDGTAPHQAVLFNNIQAGVGFLAQDYGTHGDVTAECNDSGPCTALPVGMPYNAASNTLYADDSATISSAKNVVRGMLTTGGGTINDSGSVLMDDRTSALAPHRPSDIWTGPFATADGRYLLNVGDLRAMDQATFRAAMIAGYVKQAGISAGATWL